MAPEAPEDKTLTPIKRALLEIRGLRSELERAREPIAIVGVGLRLPGGVVDLAGFERLLFSGTDAITPIPASRWDLSRLYDEDPDAPGKMTTRFGGFLEDVDRFDAEFFGISPREAASMDPQQRLLLEVAWQAIEDAGHSPASLAGTRTGVYLGIANGDYGRALFADPEAIDAYVSTGNAYSVAAGRISYFLGLLGPAVAIDTACSSSLVALHLACQGLRGGDCDLALIGGVNLVLTPELNINFSKARMMAPDGRCKTFDAAADGYVRGEGCAVIVARRLSDALADGDRVLGVIRGSAINQDGKSGGLTAPNGPAQEAVIRAALAQAGVSGREIGVVEAHGTGTSLGDPIEVGALSAVLCSERDPSQPLVIGSVKTNFGHLEAAAGVAGLLKLLVALSRREIPPSLHFQTPNPLIDWTPPIRVATATEPWPEIGGRRLAGLSSFGFSGTNSHVILEAPPPRVPAEAASQTPRRPLELLALSARSEASLRELAQSYQQRLEQEPDESLADFCFTASAGRAQLEHRLAIVGKDARELSQGLAAYRQGTPNPALATGQMDAAVRPRIAFLFTGHGAQSPGMARGLYETSEVFRSAIDACAAVLDRKLPRGLLDAMFAEGEASPLDRSLYAQPATFAVEYALSELWRSWGIEPHAVLGHSLGEYAAAQVAGLFSLEDGLALVAERGRLTDELEPGGGMGAVFASPEAVSAEIAALGGEIAIGAYNGPENVVVSGQRSQVQALLARFEARGIRAKLLRVPYASHSPRVEPLIPGLTAALERVKWTSPRCAFVSNLTGGVAGLDQVGRTEYWVSHMRRPVHFAQSIEAAVRQGITHFVEVGPHPVLLGLGAECVSASVEWLPSLRRDRPAWSDLLESLSRLYVGGAEIDWARFDGRSAPRRLALPAYPFRRDRHWSATFGRSAQPRSSVRDRWQRFAHKLERESLRGPLDLAAASYPEKWRLLARLTRENAAAVLCGAGLFNAAGEAHTLEAVLERAKIGGAYRHLVKRWLDGLVEQGSLERDGEQYRAPAALTPTGLDALWAEAERAFADNRQLFAYFKHCCALAADVLTGRESPLETLFPGGSFELARDLYERSTTMRYVNGLAAAAFEELAQALPEGRTLRVLEVGAGTGGTTSSLLPVLPAERTRYLFSDVSDIFLDRARTHFADYPYLTTARFDLDKDEAPVGHAGERFDVIVSANAVHASVDLRAALRRLHGLLAPGGVLVLVESTTHLDWFDITTGLIEGWQHFADDLRTDNPLLPPPTWVEALLAAGFEAADAFPRPGSDANELGQHVIVARVAGEALGDAAADAPVAERDPARASAAVLERGESFRQRLEAALPGERLGMVREYVREQVMAVLRLDESRPPGRNDRLMDLGFDSLMAVQLRNQLTTGLGLTRRLPVSLLFDYPTIDLLAGRLLELVAPAEAAPEPAAPQAEAPPAALDADAVARMSEAEVESALLRRLGGS